MILSGPGPRQRRTVAPAGVRSARRARWRSPETPGLSAASAGQDRRFDLGQLGPRGAPTPTNVRGHRSGGGSGVIADVLWGAELGQAGLPLVGVSIEVIDP